MFLLLHVHVVCISLVFIHNFCSIIIYTLHHLLCTTIMYTAKLLDLDDDFFYFCVSISFFFVFLSSSLQVSPIKQDYDTST